MKHRQSLATPEPRTHATTNDETKARPTIAIIIPACNEEACIGAVLDELVRTIDLRQFAVAIGVNDSSDGTARIARRYPVTIGETNERGYGHGCIAAIRAVNRAHPSVCGYVFFAGDGASNPRDVMSLAAAFAEGNRLVLGVRTLRPGNWRVMGLPHVLANVALGAWCGLLTGRWFSDLAPLRLIERNLFESLALREMTFGWTIEAQIGAALRGVPIREVPAQERRRIAGEQKVSGVTSVRTFAIGCRILAAGWRARRRFRSPKVRLEAAPQRALVRESAAGA